jgi:glutamate-1-semialdehyde 2,1-aminomutase
MTIDRTRLSELTAREQERFVAEHPKSQAAYEASTHLFGKVPMTWMMKHAMSFPIYLEAARGATITDIDGITYADFALGDTAAMAGHSPAATVRAVQERFGELGGATAMLPTEDAEWVGAELTRRFRASRWSFALTATDANRWAIRLARAVTGRSKILFNSYCYHGTVDESLIVATPEGPASRPGNVGAPCDVTETSRVAEFNDLEALEKELAQGDVAMVVMEPALTNIGIVLPDEGYLEGVRELTRRHDVLLLIDETHTISAGPCGAIGYYDLHPDIVVIGKSIGGGIPAAAYGVSAEFSESVLGRTDLDIIDMGGVGGTMAGNALSMAAARATLEEVLTDEAFAHMIGLADRFAAGVREIFARHDLPWSVSQLGARTEYRFSEVPPSNGTEAAAWHDQELDDYFHLYLANRGILLTPFHNMALMCPDTTAEQVEAHLQHFAAAVAELVAG